jgi:hypothetical protein
MTYRHIGPCLLIAILSVCSVWAQPAGEQLRGTVTLRGGETLTGTIMLAEFGVVVGAGIGTLRPDLGSICLEVEGRQVTVAGGDLALIEAEWVQGGGAENPSWEIASISLTRRDGQKLSGKPTWLLHGTTARILTDDDEIQRVSTVQPTEAGFTPDALIHSVLIGDEWPAGAVQPTDAPGAADASLPATAAPASAEPVADLGPAAPLAGMADAGAAVKPAPAGPEPVSPMTVAAADDLYGTITLRGGLQLSGAIKTVEFGAAEGAGIGAQFDGHGALTLNVGAGTVSIAAGQIMSIRATWVEETAGVATKWTLRQLDVTCFDGTHVSGTPTWHLHYSVAMVVPPEGRLQRVTAIPLSRDFSPASFVTTVQLQPASPAP